MKNTRTLPQVQRPLLAGALLAVLASPAWAVDLKTADGTWTFSIDGNVNVDYIFSSCQSPSSAATVNGGLTCVGTASGSNISNVTNGLLPAAFTFAVSTTQDGIDLSAHLGLYPGIATNDSGSPNIGPLVNPRNTALGTTGLDIRQVYMTFGNKEMGTFTVGRNIGLFGADVILNDMTLPGVGGPGSAAGAFPANTTLGGIGFGYIYTDWLAQIDYTTVDISGFNLTVGIFDPVNSLSDTAAPAGKQAPGFHAKAAYTMPIAEGTKLYLSATVLTQKQNFDTSATTSYSYTGTGIDVFAKLDMQDLELIGYYYHGDGLGTTALFDAGSIGSGPGADQTRTSDGFFAQATYKVGPAKFGVNYGESKLDVASGEVNPTLVAKNKKLTVGIYYSLTKNLTLLGEFSNVKDDAQNGGSNSANTFNVGVFLGF
jgi:predicted porin